jgi:hypothetical protein
MQQRVFWQKLLQHRLTLDERAAAQILVPAIEEVEGAVEEAHLLAFCVLQELEARAAIRVEGHEFPVDHGKAANFTQGAANRWIFARQVDQVPRIKRDRAVLDFGHQAEAVPFRLEDPVGVVEGLVGQGGKHGAEIGLHGRVLPCQMRLAVKYSSSGSAEKRGEKRGSR